MMQLMRYAELMLGNDYNSQTCSIAGALEVVGERWSLLIVRDVFLGLRRFDEMQANLGIARNVLQTRLTRLVEQGVLERRLYQERPPRYEYRLTEKGLDLWPTVVALMQWGDKHAARRPGRPCCSNTAAAAAPSTSTASARSAGRVCRSATRGHSPDRERHRSIRSVVALSVSALPKRHRANAADTSSNAHSGAGAWAKRATSSAPRGPCASAARRGRSPPARRARARRIHVRVEAERARPDQLSAPRERFDDARAVELVVGEIDDEHRRGRSRSVGEPVSQARLDRRSARPRGRRR